MRRALSRDVQLPAWAAGIYTPAMLKFFRRITTSTAGPIILGLVTFAFLILGPANGVRDVLTGHNQTAVVQAGSRTITQQEFEKIFEERKRAYEQQAQQAFPLEDALKEGVDRQLVDGLASDTAYAELLWRAGIRPSDDVVAGELKRAAESGQGSGIAEMFDSITGKFKPALLAQYLRQRGLSLEAFQRQIRDSIANEQFGSAIAAGFHTPRIYAAVQATLLLENRDITYFVIPLASVPHPPPPTDAQLTALIQAHRQQLTLPERRRLTIVKFSAQALAPSMPVDPAQVAQQFHAREATYGRPELRSFVEIPLGDPHMATAVQARLQRGEDPTAVARSIGVAAVSYADQPQSAVADVKAGQAAFAMTAGQVSGPVQGDFKTVILKVLKITPGQAASIEAARPQIEAELRLQAATEKVYDQSQKFEDAREAGSSVAEAATKVGATAISVGAVTADGKDIATGQPNPLLTQKLLKTAFDLPAGGDSEVEQDAQSGEYYAVHVDQVIPPNPPGLDEPGVRQLLTQLYLQQAALDYLKAKAKTAQDAIKAGATMEAAAKGLPIVHQIGLQRINAQQLQQQLGQEPLELLFQAKLHDVFPAGSDPLHGIAVIRMDAIRPADPNSIAALIQQVRGRLDSAYLDALANAVRAAAVQSIKPRTDLALADSAMGADAAMIARVRPPAAKPGAAPAAPAAPASGGLAK